MSSRLVRRFSTLLSGALLFAACAPEGPSIEGRLKAPERPDARISLTPAVDLSALIEPELAERMVLDEITVNLVDARLLGAHPAIPSAGLKLLLEPLLVRHSGSQAPMELPFPEEFLDDSLAVYLRLEPSEALQRASVVVRGRLFETAWDAASHKSTLASDPNAPQPDGDPAHGDDKGAPQPDGDPALLGRSPGAPQPDGDPARPCAPQPDGDPAAPQPDGDPAKCLGTKRSGLTGGSGAPYVTFELRGDDTVDLLVGFDERSQLDVVLGIPARRWFTSEAIVQLETALDDAASDPTDAEEVKSGERRPVVVKNESMSDESMPSEGNDEYSLNDRNAVNPRQVRSR